MSTDVLHLTIPGIAAPLDTAIPDSLNFGYFIPSSGVGYRLDTYDMPGDTTNFATRAVVTALEQMGLDWDRRYREYLQAPRSPTPITRPYFTIGLLSQPGGGVIKNQTEEALKYMPGNGSQVDFPYFTTGSDMPHDFVTTNEPATPTDNSGESDIGFDKVNTEALIRLLLAQPRVTKLELDPFVLDLIPTNQADRSIRDDPRVAVHGRRRSPDSPAFPTERRDLDNHMFVTFSFLAVDLAIDADNNGMIDHSAAEVEMKNWSGSTGKVMLPNIGDVNSDRIPNYADGYDIFPESNKPSSGGSFEPLEITFPDDLDLSKTKFHLTYSESDPALVTRTSPPPPFTYSPALNGVYRIWTEKGTVARKKAQINAGGDFIKSNTDYLVTDLGAHLVGRKATVYIEAVKPSVDAADHEVVIKVIPEEGPQRIIGQPADTVRVTSALCEIAVDANRDGQMKFNSQDASDATTKAKPYRFWTNDDDDNRNVTPDFPWDETDPEFYPPRRADSADRIINSKRDCEDLARLWINVAGCASALSNPADNLYLGLKWNTDAGQAPRIRLFRSADPLGGLGYIQSVPEAAIQVAGDTVTSPNHCLLDVEEPDSATPVSSGMDSVVPRAWRKVDYIFGKRDLVGLDPGSSVLPLLFEGVAEGKGQLVPVFLRRNSDGSMVVIREGAGVWVDLKNIRRMYMRAHSTPYSISSLGDFPLPYDAFKANLGPDGDAVLYLTTPRAPYAVDTAPDGYTHGVLTIPNDRLSYAQGDSITDPGGHVYPFEAAPDEEAKCVVFVHGIDMTIDAQLGYGESFFKRLWWEGYRGRFVAFRWNTVLDDNGAFLYGAGRENSSIFNSGEYRSWKGGASLKSYVETVLRRQMGDTAVISIAGHSLGNACVGEALRQGLQISSYVAMEAAVSLSCYYPEPADPATDMLVSAFQPELLTAETDKPTPQYTSLGGYAGYLRDIKTSSGATRLVAYQNIDDFWLRTGKTREIVITVPAQVNAGGYVVAPAYDLNLGKFTVDWFNYQRLCKPDDRIGYGQYLYDPDPAKLASFEYGLRLKRPVKDLHEVMAYVSRTRTFPLGAQTADGKEQPPGFDASVNMKNEYGFGTKRADHSGQFQRDIQFMYGDEDGAKWHDADGFLMPFYLRLMNSLLVAPSRP